MARKKKIWWIAIAVVVVAVAAAAFAAKTRGNGNGEEEKGPDIPTLAASIDDVQVVVREVGTVEPEVKVEIKSNLSGRVVDLPIRAGDVVTKGQLIARIEQFLAPKDAAGAPQASPFDGLDLDPSTLNVLTEYEEYRLLENLRQNKNIFKVSGARYRIPVHPLDNCIREEGPHLLFQPLRPGTMILHRLAALRAAPHHLLFQAAIMAEQPPAATVIG